jgi:hypothetical protein
MKGGASESGLRAGSTNDAWAAAMLKCRHPGAFCGADGYCHYGGECFRHGLSLEERVERLEKRRPPQPGTSRLRSRRRGPHGPHMRGVE